jgi:hypothetical protein
MLQVKRGGCAIRKHKELELLCSQGIILPRGAGNGRQFVKRLIQIRYFVEEAISASVAELPDML